MSSKTTKGYLIPVERVENAIIEIRGERIMLDADLAALYGTTTKRLNEQVKRNIERFPADFLFRLTEAEKDELVAKCDRLAGLKHSSTLPNGYR